MKDKHLGRRDSGEYCAKVGKTADVALGGDEVQKRYEECLNWRWDEDVKQNLPPCWRSSWSYIRLSHPRMEWLLRTRCGVDRLNVANDQLR